MPTKMIGIVKCPHCEDDIIIEKLNCRIFRHGIFKKNGKQIPPHSKKEICDLLVEKDLIYGCGKPFKVILQDNVYTPIICDYI
jgi:hypothetical protein